MIRTRAAALVGAAVLAATAVAGCGSGQISQTANQSPAINGAYANLGQLALRNIHLKGDQNPVTQRAGGTAELVLVIANDSPVQVDKLVSVSSPDGVGTVTLGGNTVVPVSGRLLVGAAQEQQDSAGSAASQAAPLGSTNPQLNHASAKLQLDKDLANGLTYQFTFSFEHAGDVTVAVPIDAGPDAPRQHTVGDEAGGHGHEGGAH